MSARIHQMPAHRWLPEPELAFHPVRHEDRSTHPLNGLLDFGPFSRSLLNSVLDPIRVAVIAPKGALSTVDRLLAELDNRHRPKERPQYLPEYPGFSRVFGLRTVRGDSSVRIELPGNLDMHLSASSRPHTALARTIMHSISALQSQRGEFDLLLLYLPDRWQEYFYGQLGEDFDLHDYLKAVTAIRGIPMQIIRDRALAYPCRCSVMWRLSIALYCKAGGVPWKLADTEPDMAFVGLSYAMRPGGNEEEARFVTCCSQVFDSDGAGLEFIAYETDDIHIERRNPFLSRSEMRRVMARSLALYQKRHAGRAPKRVVIHKSTEFKEEEIEGCFDAWRASEGLELVQVQQNVSWRGLQIDPPYKKGARKGTYAGYPCHRGSYLQLSGRDVLLWTQGNAPTAVGGKNFYKEGKGIPAPLLLTRFAGHGPWDEACRHLLGLTKMNWNNDGLYDRLPVTLGYAGILARTIRRLPQVAPRPYEFRFFM